jgi:hypothetical protein
MSSSTREVAMKAGTRRRTLGSRGRPGGPSQASRTLDHRGPRGGIHQGRRRGSRLLPRRARVPIGRCRGGLVHFRPATRRAGIGARCERLAGRPSRARSGRGAVIPPGPGLVPAYWESERVLVPALTPDSPEVLIGNRQGPGQLSRTGGTSSWRDRQPAAACLAGSAFRAVHVVDRLALDQPGHPVGVVSPRSCRR